MSSQTSPNVDRAASTELVARELDQKSLARVAVVAALTPGAHVHISGICGTGTASVLQLLKQLGFRVTGSDQAFYPPMGEVVTRTADQVYTGFSADHLKPRPDLVVIGNALSRGNPEVEEVLANSIPFASMPEVFAALLIGTREHCPISIVVCGTHGKTTTSAAVAWVLEYAKRRPGYFVGGVPINLPSSIRAVDTSIPLAERAVVLEGDEYDSAFFSKFSKFHSYRPDVLIITSIEFDHADIYFSIEDIELEFSKLVARVPRDGVVFVAEGTKRLDALFGRWQADPAVVATLQRYGTHTADGLRIVDRAPCELPSESTGELPGELPGELTDETDAVTAGARVAYGQRVTMELGLPDQGIETIAPLLRLGGLYNATNLLAAAGVAHRLGVPAKVIAEALAEFRGVLRRQQIIFDADGILVLEDFAHHPTAVAATLAGLTELYPGRRLIAVFEPRSNTSRRAYFQAEYGACFTAADIAVLLEVQEAGGYSATNSEVAALNLQQVLTDATASGVEAYCFATVDEIEKFLSGTAKAGDVIVLMSNGAFGGLPMSLPLALAGRQQLS